MINNSKFSKASITHRADLTASNTMHLGCVCDTLVTFAADANEDEVRAVMTELTGSNQPPLFILSGGSNVILPPKLQATVIRPTLRGIRIVNGSDLKRDLNHSHLNESHLNESHLNESHLNESHLSNSDAPIDIEVMAGENWHDLVVSSVANGWYGLENLALIPGLTGAAPVQNIGAYGVQLADRLTHVRALHLPTLTWHTLDKTACEFGYRDSKFKQQAGQWLITTVGFRLHQDSTQLTADYGDVLTLATTLAADNTPVTPTHIMQAIINIRQSKLPNPKLLPNCGSFFKNPIITTKQFIALQQRFPNIVGYTVDATHTKVAAGWLIDAAGLKGQGIAPIVTHNKQALVLVNQQPLTSDKPVTQAAVFATQQFIQQKIAAMFAITLEPEPVWVDKLL